MIELDTVCTRGGFRLELALHLGAAATGVFGPSGAGKSTFLHALAGLVRPERQRLTVAGQVIDDGRRRSRPEHRGVGLVFQDHRLFPHRTVAQNLRYGLRPGPISYDAVVALLGLETLLTRMPTACSGGERQRVALGRALLAQPRLLLLDEPLASLDRGLKRQILPYLRRLRRILPCPLLHVSHDLDELLAVTDELVLLDRGRLVAQGRLADLAARAELLPLLHDLGLVNVLPGQVVSHDPEAGLSLVQVSGASALRCAVAATPLPVGSAVEILLRPSDVVLGRGEPGLVSLSGRAAATVAGITATPQRTLVRLELGAAVPLLAEVSAGAVQRLQLAPGATVLALWKAQAATVREAAG